MPGVSFIMSTLEDNSVTPGTIGFGVNTRKWAALSIGQQVQVEPYRFDLEKHCISTLTVEVDFYSKKNISTEDFNSDLMTAEFCSLFGNISLTEGQPFLFKYGDKHLLSVTVKGLEAS